MTTLEILTVEKIRSWEPCRDPVTECKYIAEDWTGTILDILEMSIRHEHKLWCVRKSESISIRASQEFAIFCGHQALSYIENPDPRSVAALKAAELYLNGEISREKMQTAISAADEAIDFADDANATAHYADKTIYFAARAVKDIAANLSLVDYAAEAAENTAYYAAKDDAAETAYYAAKAEAEEKQIAKLKKLILGNK